MYRDKPQERHQSSLVARNYLGRIVWNCKSDYLIRGKFAQFKVVKSADMLQGSYTWGLMGLGSPNF